MIIHVHHRIKYQRIVKGVSGCLKSHIFFLSWTWLLNRLSTQFYEIVHLTVTQP